MNTNNENLSHLRKPDFIIIGGQKTGSSSLIKTIATHPECALRPKLGLSEYELRYFFELYNWGAKGFQHYLDKLNRLISPNKKKGILGEKTPSYILIKEGIEEILSNFPDIRLIYSLREPTMRAFSQWKICFHQIGYIKFIEWFDAFRHRPWEDIKFNIQHGYGYQRGLYGEHLLFLQDVIPEDRLLVTVAEERWVDPMGEYRKIYEFLGIDPSEIMRTKFKNVNKTPGKRSISPDEYNYVNDFFKKDKSLLYDVLGRRIGAWDKISEKFA